MIPSNLEMKGFSLIYCPGNRLSVKEVRVGHKVEQEPGGRI